MSSSSTVNRKLRQKEKNYIRYCELYYFARNSKFPSAEEAAKALGYSVAEINYFLKNAKVRKALEDRGLPWQQSGWEADNLTPVQIAAAILVSNFADVRTIEEKLDTLGVSPTQYYAWLNDDRFKAFVNRLADRNLENIRPEAVAAFTRRLREGYFPALKFYFEATGQFKQPDVANLEAFVHRVIEAIQRHVKDPQILAAIASDIMGASPVAVNNVIQQREITAAPVEENKMINPDILKGV